MTILIKIIGLIVAVQCYVSGRPLLQGISFQRGFDIQFKTKPRQPIAFIKEKWSPFGRFGIKHALQKRDLDTMTEIKPEVLPAPVVEEIPPSPANTEEEENLEGSPSHIIHTPYHPPIETNLVIAPAPVEEIPSDSLNTDISRAELVNEYLSSVERPEPVVEEKEVPPAAPPPPEVTVVEGPPAGGIFYRGSKIALYFGNVFLSLMSAFLANARSALERLPPVYSQ